MVKLISGVLLAVSFFSGSSLFAASASQPNVSFADVVDMSPTFSLLAAPTLKQIFHLEKGDFKLSFANKDTLSIQHLQYESMCSSKSYILAAPLWFIAKFDGEFLAVTVAPKQAHVWDPANCRANNGTWPGDLRIEADPSAYAFASFHSLEKAKAYALQNTTTVNISTSPDISNINLVANIEGGTANTLKIYAAAACFVLGFPQVLSFQTKGPGLPTGGHVVDLVKNYHFDPAVSGDPTLYFTSIKCGYRTN